MDTLVISATYEPMYRVDWQRAMTLWAAGRVEVLDTYLERVVRTVEARFALPSIIRFKTGGSPYRGGVRFSRENVFKRDKGRCQYCDCVVRRNEITYDHVVPRRSGGKSSWENLVLACRGCNQVKGGRTPVQAGMRLRTKPGVPRSLPTVREILSFEEGMPSSWRPFLVVERY
jgi:5-methylcytosine-specific restriction endonuclease McrA